MGEFVIPWALGSLLLPTQGLAFVYGLLGCSLLMLVVLVLLIVKGSTQPKRRPSSPAPGEPNHSARHHTTEKDTMANGRDHNEEMVALDEAFPPAPPRERTLRTTSPTVTSPSLSSSSSPPPPPPSFDPETGLPTPTALFPSEGKVVM